MSRDMTASTARIPLTIESFVSEVRRMSASRSRTSVVRARDALYVRVPLTKRTVEG